MFRDLPQVHRAARAAGMSTRPGAYGVVRRDGLVLLVWDQEDEQWYFPGGGIEAGESPEEALAREVREETGFRLLSCTPLVYAEQPTAKGVTKECHFFLAEVDDAEPGPAEHEAAWVPLPRGARPDGGRQPGRPDPGHPVAGHDRRRRPARPRPARGRHRPPPGRGRRRLLPRASRSLAPMGHARRHDRRDFGAGAAGRGREPGAGAAAGRLGRRSSPRPRPTSS